MKFQLWILLLLFPMITIAAVYQYKDAEGNVYYTDQPKPGSKKVELPQSTIIKNNTTDDKVDGKKEIKSDKGKSIEVKYKKFEISSPLNSQTFQNQRAIPIQLSVDPKLQGEDKIGIYLDGNLVIGPSPQQEFTLKQPDRGTHTVQAKLFDKYGVIKSQSDVVTIYVHYASVGGKKGS